MPKHIIFHIDVNSAFLSWSAVQRLRQGDTLDLRSIPSVVGGDEDSRHGIVLAASLPAKYLGICTGQPLWEARQKVPNLTIVPADFDCFRSMSRAMQRLLYDFSPLVEPYSIDECFLDYTGMEGLFGPPLQGAELIRRRIKEELGFTVNIGISCNKILAKMASDLEKPDRIHTLWPEEVPEKMWPLPVGNLFMVGRSTRRALEEMGLRTIGQLAKTELSLLTARFKSHGALIWHYANGMEPGASPVRDSRPPHRCISNSTTTPRDIYDYSNAHSTLLMLCEHAAHRLRKQRQFASMVGVEVRHTDFSSLRKQMRISPTDCTRTLYQMCIQLFDEMWDRSPLRHLGVSFGGLSGLDGWQPSLFDEPDQERLRALEQTVDSIQERYGAASIQKAAVMDLSHEMRRGNHDGPVTAPSL